MFYSEETGAFYDPAIHGQAVPADAVELTRQEYGDLLDGLSAGRRVVIQQGRPVLVFPPPSAPPSREEVEAARLRAYADPLTGSDRYFAEAQRESLMGNEEAAEAAKALGMARFAEVQAEYPWPPE